MAQYMTTRERDLFNLFTFDFPSSGGFSFTNTTTVFPPYEIKKMKGEKYVIELAVAGYKKDDLDVKVERNILTVKGKHCEENSDVEKVLQSTMKKGKFTRSFTLGENVNVCGSKLEDGLLKIFLEKIIPESDLPQKIMIK